MRSFLPAERSLGWLVPVLAVVAEAALLAVVYLAVRTTIDGQAPLLGTLELAVATGIGALVVRRRWFDPDADTGRFLGLLLVLGIVGWAWDSRVRELLGDGLVIDALGTHLAGWLTLIAAMRGVSRGGEIDDRAMTRFVLAGVPALAIPWTVGQLGPASLRSTFTEEAFVASLTFVTAGFIAAGLARLGEIGRETGVDWRRDRSWLGTVLGVLGIVLALGVPASMLLGLPGSAVARGILDPIITVIAYLVIGVAAAGVFAAALIAGALRSLGIELPGGGQGSGAGGLPLPEAMPYTIEELRDPITIVAAAWVVLIVIGVVVLRVWLRRRRRGAVGPLEEERRIELPERAFRVRLPRRERRAPAAAPIDVPHDAVTAYLASLHDLSELDPDRARADHETPRRHAVRIGAGPELGALQAGYALARYGDRRLTDAEHRRAVSRWRRLRRRLGGP